jgi:tetratricopeptide (TPR) repeat protein
MTLFRARMLHFALNLAWVAVCLVPGTLAFVYWGARGIFITALWCMFWVLARFRIYWRIAGPVIGSALKRAYEREDAAAARIIVRAFYPRTTAWERFFYLMAEATVLLMEERHQEGRDLLLRVRRASVPAPYRALYDNNLAWGTALAGDPEKAIELAREAVTAANSPEQRAYTHGTLGVALCLAGRHSEALAALEVAMARDDQPRQRATRNYYTALSLAALNRHDEARAALEIAAAVPTRDGARARARLAQKPAAPYR